MPFLIFLFFQRSHRSSLFLILVFWPSEGVWVVFFLFFRELLTYLVYIWCVFDQKIKCCYVVETHTCAAHGTVCLSRLAWPPFLLKTGCWVGCRSPQ